MHFLGHYMKQLSYVYKNTWSVDLTGITHHGSLCWSPHPRNTHQHSFHSVVPQYSQRTSDILLLGNCSGRLPWDLHCHCSHKERMTAQGPKDHHSTHLHICTRDWKLCQVTESHILETYHKPEEHSMFMYRCKTRVSGEVHNRTAKLTVHNGIFTMLLEKIISPFVMLHVHLIWFPGQK